MDIDLMNAVQLIIDCDRECEAIKLLSISLKEKVDNLESMNANKSARLRLIKKINRNKVVEIAALCDDD